MTSAHMKQMSSNLRSGSVWSNLQGETSRICVNQLYIIYVTGYGKRAHFAQELIFQNKQLKYVTPLDFVHNSDSLKCYNFSQEDQFFML